MHRRRVIREAIAARVTGLTTTGPNVFESRAYRLNPTELPALAVFSNVEQSERSTADDDIERILEIDVEGYAKANENVDDVLDNMAEEVEVALGSDPSLSGLADDMYLTATTMQLNVEGDKIVGVVTLTYAVEYRTPEGDPTTGV